MKKIRTHPIERRVPATVWTRQGARLRFPRTTTAVIAWSVDDLGDPSMVVQFKVTDHLHVDLPYEVVRRGAEQGRLWWSGRVRTWSDEGVPDHAVALVVVPSCRLLYSKGRTELIPSHVSIEFVGQPDVLHVELHELQRALLLPGVSPRMHRLLRPATRGSNSSPWTRSTVA